MHRWYRLEGRHHLPWRLTHDPWAILVSEVMLQQTQVVRVPPRWERFMARWPSPAALAATPLEELLREWAGLGYPRRAAALHRCAAMVAAHGWPHDEAGLRALPGIGEYTARALLHLALGGGGQLPCDVNIARVTARCALGSEPQELAQRALADAVEATLVGGGDSRHHVYALFDLGATFCTARRPRCGECPLRAHCVFAATGRSVAAARRSQGRWQGSTRQLRGAVLRCMLGPESPGSAAALTRAVQAELTWPGAPAVVGALAGLVGDGLLLAPPWLDHAVPRDRGDRGTG